MLFLCRSIWLLEAKRQTPWLICLIFLCGCSVIPSNVTPEGRKPSVPVTSPSTFGRYQISDLERLTLEERALSGDNFAIRRLIEHSKFVLRDPAKTLLWLRVGSSYGGHDFQHELGITLLQDSEVAVRYEGLAILMQVAKSGEAPAALSLGHELERSRLLYENELNPLSWFILAARAGSSFAYLSVSRLLYEAKSESDRVEALAWAILACRRAPVVMREQACEWLEQISLGATAIEYEHANSAAEDLLIKDQ